MRPRRAETRVGIADAMSRTSTRERNRRAVVVVAVTASLGIVGCK